MGYLFAAFAIVWLVFFGYLFVLHKKQNQAIEEMKDLEKRIP